MVCPIALGDHNKAQTCTQETQNCTSLITLKTNLNKFAILGINKTSFTGYGRPM